MSSNVPDIYSNIQDMVDVKIGDYKVIKWTNILLMVYWTHDGEKQCRIIKHEGNNMVGEIYTLYTPIRTITYVELDKKELQYWRQFVKLCDL